MSSREADDEEPDQNSDDSVSEDQSEIAERARARWWWIARVTNMVVSLYYLILLGSSIWLVIKLYFYGGRWLLNTFDIADRRVTSLVPVWCHIPDQLSFGQWLKFPYFLVILLCNIWLLDFALCFDLMLWGKSGLTCLLAIGMILFTMLLEGGIFYNINGPDSPIIVNIKAIMQTQIKLHYRVITTNDLTVALNMLMIAWRIGKIFGRLTDPLPINYLTEGDCCGFSGPLDFKNVPLKAELIKNNNPYADFHYYPDSPDWLRTFVVPYENIDLNVTFTIPPACCNDNVSDAIDSKVRFNQVVDCATKSTFTSQHNLQGCLGYFYENHFPSEYRITVITLVLFYQTLQILLIIVIIITAPNVAFEDEDESEADDEDDNNESPTEMHSVAASASDVTLKATSVVDPAS